MRHHVARDGARSRPWPRAAGRGEQAAEAAVGGAVAGIAEEREAAGEIEPRARQEPQAPRLRRDSLRCDVGAHGAGQGVAVGDADGGEPELRRPLHQFVGVGGAAQEAEVAHRLQLGVGRGSVVSHVARERARWRGPNSHLPLSPYALTCLAEGRNAAAPSGRFGEGLGDLVPLADHLCKRQMGVRERADLVEHESEVTPGVCGRRRLQAVPPGGNGGGVADQFFHQQRHQEFSVEPRPLSLSYLGSPSCARLEALEDQLTCQRVRYHAASP